MKVLFDQGVPAPLRRELPGHSVDTLFERGWSGLENGKLLDAAEADAYAVLVTPDQNIKHQQNLVGRKLAVVVLLSTAWPKIKARSGEVLAAVEAAKPGTYQEVAV
jgi:hypothetical protein